MESQLKECAAVLPVVGNDGASLAAEHDALACTLAREFGGVTVHDCTGLWNDGGQLQAEKGRRYVCAIDPDFDWRFGELVISAACDMRQKAAYWRDSDGRVHIVTIDNARVAVVGIDAHV